MAPQDRPVHRRESPRSRSPDPFAFTTAGAGEAYPGEAVTRHFNLTHEWLAQVLFYLVWRAAGFAGVVLFRALLLAAFCALAGLVAWRRCGGFYRSLAAACATAGMAIPFALDRPYLITFLLLAATVAILEYRRWLWLLPPLFLVWANCHGGYFLGWVVLAAYSAEALWQRSDARRVCLVSGLAVLLSGVNPNGFRIVQVLLYYRASYLTSKLLEWARPAMFALERVHLPVARRRAADARGRGGGFGSVDWLLFAAFAAAAFSAQRNTILIGLIAPIVIVTYFPWKRALPPLAPFAASLALIGWGMAASWGNALPVARGRMALSRRRGRFSAGAPRHRPDLQYLRIRRLPDLAPVARRARLHRRPLAQRIGVPAITAGFFTTWRRAAARRPATARSLWRPDHRDEYLRVQPGPGLPLAPALADPQQTEWKLVYDDPTAIVLMRQPPAGVAPLDSLRILTHMEAECDLHLRHQPGMPLCARALGQVFTRVGDLARARRWYGIYLQQAHGADAEAEQAYRTLVNSGR